MDSKKWYQSKAIWGGVLAAVAALADMFTNGGLTMQNGTAFLGGLLAIYGRVVASTAISH